MDVGRVSGVTKETRVVRLEKEAWEDELENVDTKKQSDLHRGRLRLARKYGDLHYWDYDSSDGVKVGQIDGGRIYFSKTKGSRGWCLVGVKSNGEDDHWLICEDIFKCIKAYYKRWPNPNVLLVTAADWTGDAHDATGDSMGDSEGSDSDEDNNRGGGGSNTTVASTRKGAAKAAKSGTDASKRRFPSTSAQSKKKKVIELEDDSSDDSTVNGGEEEES